MIQLLTNERAFVGTKERKVREKEQRKETILSAAVQIIAEKGFECATMEDIAAGSELSKGTLYLYFEDKSSLFRAIKTEAHDQIRSIFLEIIQQDLPGLEMVTEMGRAFIEFIRTHPVHTQSMMLLPHTTDEKEHFDKGRELMVLITHAIQIGIQDGSIRKTVNPKLLSIQVGWGLFGILQYYMNESDPVYDEILKENNTTIKKLTKDYITVLLANIKADNKTTKTS